LLYIGNQQRPNIFDLEIKIPDVLYDEVIEVDERVLLVDNTCQMDIDGRRVKTDSGKEVS
jgi:5-oxoprolinase (ATP-hydrolysing)